MVQHNTKTRLAKKNTKLIINEKQKLWAPHWEVRKQKNLPTPNNVCVLCCFYFYFSILLISFHPAAGPAVSRFVVSIFIPPYHFLTTGTFQHNCCLNLAQTEDELQSFVLFFSFNIFVSHIRTRLLSSHLPHPHLLKPDAELSLVSSLVRNKKHPRTAKLKTKITNFSFNFTKSYSIWRASEYATE